MRCEGSSSRWLAGTTCRNERALPTRHAMVTPQSRARGKVMPKRRRPLGGTNGVVTEGTSPSVVQRGVAWPLS